MKFNIFPALKDGDFHQRKFSLHRLLNSRLHERSVSPLKYIRSSVLVGIRAETAGGTDEARLAFSTSTVQGSAARTSLRSVSRIDFHDPEGFVEQHRLDLMPSNVQNSPVQAALLSDVLAGFGNRAARGFRHVLSAQTLNHDGSEFPGNLGCRFMRPMLADAGAFGAEGGNAALCLAVTVGPALSPTGDALSLTDAPVHQRDGFGQMVARSIGQHQRNCNAPVYADCAANVLNIPVDFAANGNLPAKGGSRDGGLCHLAFNVAGHTKFDPPNLRQANAPPPMVQAFNQDLAPVEGKGVVDALLLWLRESAKSFESAAVGVIQSFEDVLLSGLAALSDKVNLGPKRGQFPRLRHVVQVIASPRLIVSPVIAALLKSKVPHQAANPRDLTKLFSLFRRRAQREGEASENHINLYCTFNPKTQERRAFLSGLNAGVSSASVR